MKHYNNLILLAIPLLFFSCTSSRKAITKDDGKITVQLLQVNDVYEIAPVEAGKAGGMARVATVKKELLQQNANTYLVMAGDFLSPSVYNSLKYEGKRIRGQQMVEAMNAAGMDIAVFGNHEFDISEEDLQSRINESSFSWIASNSFHQTNTGIIPFVKSDATGNHNIPASYIMNVKDADGTAARIGFIGINIPFNKAPYVSYTDPIATAVSLYNSIKDSCDAVIAITHQLMADDILLAKTLPGLAAIIGGHEHDMRYQQVGDVVISKAHANARSVYVVKLQVDKNKHSHRVKSTLKMIDEKVALDSATNLVVQKWGAIAVANYASIGFDANKIVLKQGEPLDAREATIRRSKTNFSTLIVRAMETAAPQADIAIVNSGSIRLDDVLYPPVTQYDILRSLPFGGGIVEVDMKGSLLLQILKAGRNNVGIGGFLQYSETLSYDTTKSEWTFKNQQVAPEKVYRVALTDFMMTGGEANMNFLTKTNPAIVKVYPQETAITDARSDIRLAIVRYMEQLDK